MDVKELVEKYNQALQMGVNSQDFADSIGMQRKSIQQKLRRAGYVFDKELNCYVLNDAGEEKEIQKAKPEVKKDCNKSNTEVLQELKALSKRVEILENKERTENRGDRGESLQLREFNSPVKQISYRYHTEVLQALDDLCKAYPHFTKHSIINSLLMDAIERVKK